MRVQSGDGIGAEHLFSKDPQGKDEAILEHIDRQPVIHLSSRSLDRPVYQVESSQIPHGAASIPKFVEGGVHQGG